MKQVLIALLVLVSGLQVIAQKQGKICELFLGSYNVHFDQPKDWLLDTVQINAPSRKIIFLYPKNLENNQTKKISIRSFSKQNSSGFEADTSNYKTDPKIQKLQNNSLLQKYTYLRIMMQEKDSDIFVYYLNPGPDITELYEITLYSSKNSNSKIALEDLQNLVASFTIL